MCEFIKPKKLAFEKVISKSSKPQIKPFLSKEVEQPEKLKFDIMKNELSKPHVLPVQIKSENQNAEEIKTDFVSDEEVAAELGSDYDPPCSQLTYKSDIRNAKARILEHRKKKFVFLPIRNFRGVDAGVKCESSDNVMDEAEEKQFIAVN